MSNKKSQRIISDISEKLKKTIKKYNEMSIDNDLSLQKSNDISEILMKSKTGPIQEENDLSTSKIKNERNSTNEIIDSRQNAFISQANQIIKNLNAFEDCINNDFDDLEQFVENEIEKELTTTYR